MKQAVVCIAPDVVEAEKEVTTLREAGFSTDDISVLWPDPAGAQELGYEQHTKAPEGAAWGVFFGAVIGGILAYLNFHNFMWTPWTQDLLRCGETMGILAGMGALGTLGFVLGLICGLPFPEYEAKKYERKIKVGSTLVAVHTDTSAEAKAAEKVLKRAGGLGIHHVEETARCLAKCDKSETAVG